MKRLLDLVLVIPGLLLLSPLLAVVSLRIKLSSPGPILFRQARIGRHGRAFYIYKFRTMVTDKTDHGPKVTASDDPRITPFGRALRQSKLDELPQLLNVLRGDMSLVGPRPQVPRFVAHFSDTQRQVIFSVRPGLTDLATLRYRNEENLLAKCVDPEQLYIQHILPDKLRLNINYVRQQSLIGDLRILLRTMICLLQDRRNATVEPLATSAPISEWLVELTRPPSAEISRASDSHDDSDTGKLPTAA